MSTMITELGLMQLSPQSRELVLGIAQEVHFDEGETIFREGDHARNLYVLLDGEVSVETNAPPRGSIVINTIGPGEWFSWSALLEPWIETATCRAIEPSDALAIRGGALMDLCRDDTKLGFEVYRMLASVVARRLVATTLQLVDLGE